MNRKQLVVDGLVTTYYQSGEGPILLLLHGWADQAKTFKLLAEKLPQYQIVAPDLPGFGETGPPPKAWGLDDYGEFLRAFLEKLEIGRPRAIIAHSNGGSIAIKALANSFIAADKLVLLASAGIRNRQKARKFGLKIIAKTGKVATAILPDSSKQSLRSKLYGRAGSDLLVSPHMQGTFKKTVGEDVQADAKALHLPTLLIYGSNDTATPPIYGEIFTRLIENSRLEIISNAEHFLHQSDSVRVARKIEEFLR